MATHAPTKDVVGRNVRRLREASGKGKSELCRSVKMSRSFWDEVESGLKDCSTGTLDRIAIALGVKTADLIIESGNGNGKRHK